MSDSEHETEQESAPRFNKAIIGRIFAVGVFVALGTFAVIQSMGGNGIGDENNKPVAKKLDPSESDPSKTDPTKPGPSQPGQDKSDPTKSVPSKSGDGKAAVKTKTAADLRFQTGFKGPGNEKNKAAQSQSSINPKIVKPKGADFNPALPAPKSFGSNQVKRPVVPSIPQDKPPERFAQAGGQPFGAQNGFQARKPDADIKSPIPNIQIPVGTSFGETAKTPTQKPSPNKTPIQSTAQAAEDLLKKVSDEAAAAKQKIAGGIRGVLPQGQARESFAPPTAQSNFAGPPKTGFNANTSVGVFGNTPRKPNTGGFESSNSINDSGRLAPINSSKSAANSGGFKPDVSAFDSNQVFEPRKPAIPGSANSGSSTNLRNSAGADLRGSSRTNNNGITNQQPTGSSRPFGSQTSQGSTIRSNAFSQNENTPAKSVSAPFQNNRPSSRLNSIPIPNATTTSASNTALTKNIPGERQLEGVQAPALSVEKLSPQEIQVNTPADFQLVIKNVGRVSAEDVTVFDQIPNGTQFLSASPEPNLNQGGNLQWKIGKLRPGQEKRIKIQLKPIRHGEIGSVAHVTFATQASMRTLVTKPVLEIVHQAKAIHLIGDDVMFDITVKNKGDGPATNVMIQEDVPKQLEFQDGSQGIEFEIGTLMPGQSRRIQLALKAAQIGKMQNIMFASADGGLQAKHELPLEVVAPNLVTKTDGPTIRYLQRNVTHTFSVANNGTAAATNVELIARLPSGLRFVSANNQGRYRQNDHSVFWSLAKLDRDVNASVELKTTPVEVGSQPIKFESFADLEVRSSVVQPLTVEHLVDVFIDIDDVVDPIEIGADTSYKVRVVNQGTKAATNVQLNVEFPQGLQPTSIDGSLRHQINGQRIAFEPINSLSPGDEINFVIHSKGTAPGDHRVVVSMQTDGRQTRVSKEETTRVYSDR